MSFNTFVSYKHDNLDKPYIQELVKLLRAYNLTVWFDEDELQPGISWQSAMEQGIRNSKSGLILLGERGIGPWHNEEIQALLQFAVKQNMPVIPVLLPNAKITPELPIFLGSRTWVDMRPTFTPENISQLIWGITSTKTPPRPFPPSFRPRNLDEYIAKKGHLVHKLKAKDSTGRWAYYFVLVEPELEQAFMNSLASDQNLDLEHYGKVVASCYGEKPTPEVKEFLKNKYGFDV